MKTLTLITALVAYLITAGLSSAANVLNFSADTDRVMMPPELVTSQWDVPTGTTNGVLVTNALTGAPLATASTLAGSALFFNGVNVTGVFSIQFPPATIGWFTFSVPTPYGGRLVTDMQYVTSDGAGDLKLNITDSAILAEAFPHGTTWKTELISRFGYDGPNIIVPDITDPNNGAGLGSGVEWWPSQGVYLVADNNANNLRRVTEAGVITGSAITLPGFWDVEEIRVVDSDNNIFAISQEFSTSVAGSANEIVVIAIAPGATSISRTNAIRILRPTLAGETQTTHNLGYEAMAYDSVTNRFYFCLEKASNVTTWNVWWVANDGGAGSPPTATPAATAMFSLNKIKGNKANDIASMAITPWRTLLLAADEGAGTTAAGTATQMPRLIQIGMAGELFDDTLPPLVKTALPVEHFRQLEGVCFRRTSGNVLKLVLTGEKDNTTGADWQVLE